MGRKHPYGEGTPLTIFHPSCAPTTTIDPGYATVIYTSLSTQKVATQQYSAHKKRKKTEKTKHTTQRSNVNK